MGTKSWLLFKSVKEAQAAWAFLAPLDSEIVLPRSSCFLVSKSPKVLAIEANYVSALTEIHYFVQREICRRFDVRKIGADSVGWYRNSDFDERIIRARYPGCVSWAAWAKSYKPEWSLSLPNPERPWKSQVLFEQTRKNCVFFLKETERLVTEIFTALDRHTAEAKS